MQSAVAIITFRREHAIRTLLDSIAANNLHKSYPVAVFEDCGNRDGTVACLTEAAKFIEYDRELNSDKFHLPLGDGHVEVYIGRRREGVAGQSNKALRWFERLDADHLCLCNDDVLATGDFVKEYQDAVVKLGFEFLTFCPFEDETHRATIVRYKMREVRVMIRMVGIMLSLTKRVVKTIGYFDERFGFFGDEHCEINNRARLAGFINLNNQPQLGLDIVSKHLKAQAIESSIYPFEKPVLDQQGAAAIAKAASEYFNRALYRQYRLRHPKAVNDLDGVSGILSQSLDALGVQLVYEYAVDEEAW